MDDKNAKNALTKSMEELHPQGENLDVEWGETHQERMLEKPSRSESVRHDCKGRHCDTAFDKL